MRAPPADVNDDGPVERTAGEGSAASGTARWTAVAGVAALALGAIGCWWLAARVLVPEYRPELLGAQVNGDTAHPLEGAVWVTIALVLIGVGFAVWLFLAARSRPARTCRVAGVIVAVGLLVLGARAVVQSEPRCSLESYTQTTTCASERRTLAADLAMIAVPGAVALGVLALGGAHRGHRMRRGGG